MNRSRTARLLVRFPNFRNRAFLICPNVSAQHESNFPSSRCFQEAVAWSVPSARKKELGGASQTWSLSFHAAWFSFGIWCPIGGISNKKKGLHAAAKDGAPARPALTHEHLHATNQGNSRIQKWPSSGLLMRRVGHVPGRLLSSANLRAKQRGCLKDTCCNHLKHGFFNTNIKGNHNLQGDVQVYNVRIPEQEQLFGSANLDSFLNVFLLLGAPGISTFQWLNSVPSVCGEKPGYWRADSSFSSCQM